MDSRRLLIVKKVITLIKTMTTVNSYTVIPKKVYLGRSGFTGMEAKPYVTVVEVPEQPEETVLSDSDPIDYHRISLAIYGYIASDHDDDPTTPAYEFLAELRRCLRGGQQSKLDGSVIGVNISPGYTWQDEKTQMVYCAINLKIDFEEVLDNPYQPLGG